MNNAMKKIDVALDAFWVGFLYVGACRIRSQYHKAVRNYYLNQLRHVRGTKVEVELSYRAMRHNTFADIAVAHIK